MQASFDNEPYKELEAEISHPAERDLDTVQRRMPACTYPLPKKVVVSNTEQGATVMLLDKTGHMRRGKIQVKTPSRELPKKSNPSCTHWVDLLSRMIFPASYATFLVLFWSKFVEPLPIWNLNGVHFGEIFKKPVSLENKF